MPSLYGRLVKATIQPKDGDGFTIDGHDVSFDIEKNREQEPNKAKFVFFNLPEELRNKLQLKDTATIDFSAGYPDTIASLFKGNIVHSLSELQGPDIVTNIEAAEGNKAYRSSFVAKTYGPGTPFKTVVRDIVKSFEGFQVTSAITKIIDSIGNSFPDGLTLDGQSCKVLNDVLKPVGLAYSIQNGQIQITKKGQPTSDPRIAINYTSGLVDVPQLGEKKEQATLTFKSLVRADLFPGRKVAVNWILGGGNYALDSVKHKGSNFDNEFYSYCEAFVP